MKKHYVHIRLGVILAGEAQADLIAEPLSNAHNLRIECFEQVHDAAAYTRDNHPKVVIADFERFGAAGVYGLADFMDESDCPVILVVRDPSEWELDRFDELGVQAVFAGKFKISELSVQVRRALGARSHIDSSGSPKAMSAG